MKEIDKKIKRKFLKKLTELTRKTGIGISGCGCCGSPYLFEIRDKENSKYIVGKYDDNLEWKKEENYKLVTKEWSNKPVL